MTLTLAETARPGQALAACLADFLRNSDELHRSYAGLLDRAEQRESLALLGERAATLAHEVRNPLHAIEGFASLLLRALPEEPALDRARGYARNLARGARELTAIVTGLLELSRPDRRRREVRDVSAIARRAVELATSSLDADAASRLRVRVDADAGCEAPVDEASLLSAIRNLVANAVEAMPRGGAIRVSVRAEDGELVVRVADGGPGIPAALRARLFAPFVTTKPRGTGLGLAVVARVAAAHGGRAELEPSKRGAVFAIRIPLTVSEH
jgi:signal transduction histidine kinase